MNETQTPFDLTKIVLMIIIVSELGYIAGKLSAIYSVLVNQWKIYYMYLYHFVG